MCVVIVSYHCSTKSLTVKFPYPEQASPWLYVTEIACKISKYKALWLGTARLDRAYNPRVCGNSHGVVRRHQVTRPTQPPGKAA
jgi:hypothetical protein